MGREGVLLARPRLMPPAGARRALREPGVVGAAPVLLVFSRATGAGGAGLASSALGLKLMPRTFSRGCAERAVSGWLRGEAEGSAALLDGGGGVSWREEDTKTCKSLAAPRAKGHLPAQRRGSEAALVGLPGGSFVARTRPRPSCPT